ncbi:MAG: metallophosphoesterase [Anaerolineales bacterium]|nr:metallophosphoesterase [Anaerolineales bacterium]
MRAIIESGLALALLSAVLGFIAGAGVYVFSINRLLGYLRDSLIKSILLPSTLFLVIGGWCLWGILSPRTALPFTMTVLVGMALGEIGTSLLRRFERGAPPISTSGPLVTWRHPLTTTALQVIQYQVPVAGWQGPALRIAQLSDWHVSEKLPLEYFHQAIAQSNQKSPDLVFLTGDFITKLSDLRFLLELLQAVESRLGTYAILGNHDYWADAGKVSACLRQAGVHMLHNGWEQLLIDDKRRVLILGCEDPWGDDRWEPPNIQNADLVLALSHTADHIYRLQKAGAQVVFSGHYHAGQIQLPVLGPVIIPSKYGKRFQRGHFLIRGAHLFVSAGIGGVQPPARIYCPPDILIVDIVPSSG